MNKYQAIILAAGNGSRMKSKLPKVMHKVGTTPMLEHVIMNTWNVTKEIFLVHSKRLKRHINVYKEYCHFVLQSLPLGTADAVNVVLNKINHDKYIVVLYADNPFITSKIINEMFDFLISTNSDVAILSFERDDPGEYGRVVVDVNNRLSRIVEFKNATLEEKAIRICNSGIMVFNKSTLKQYLPILIKESSSSEEEIYITGIIKTIINYGGKASYLLSPNAHLVVGINTLNELAEANNRIQLLK